MPPGKRKRKDDDGDGDDGDGGSKPPPRGDATIGQLTSGIRNKQVRSEKYKLLKHRQKVGRDAGAAARWPRLAACVQRGALPRVACVAGA